MMDNGMMKESLDGYAVLADMEKETFLGFCEFVYQGHYKTPSHAEPDGRDSTSPTAQS